MYLNWSLTSTPSVISIVCVEWLSRLLTLSTPLIDAWNMHGLEFIFTRVSRVLPMPNENGISGCTGYHESQKSDTDGTTSTSINEAREFKSNEQSSTAFISICCFSLKAVSLSISTIYFSKLFKVFPTKTIVEIVDVGFWGWPESSSSSFLVIDLDLTSYMPDNYDTRFSI